MELLKKLLTIVFLILFSPVIVLGLLVFLVHTAFNHPKNKKVYKKSHYYLDTRRPYSIGCLNSEIYRFYNSAKNRGLAFEYHYLSDAKLEYFIINNTAYFLPFFGLLNFDEEKNKWEMYLDGKWCDADTEYACFVEPIKAKLPNLPVKILTERSAVNNPSLNAITLPEYISLCVDYETAFKDTVPPAELIFPQNTDELYQMLCSMPELCGDFKLADGSLLWSLNKDTLITILVDTDECRIDLDFKGTNITHWHTDNSDICQEICRLGTKGSVLIVKRTFFFKDLIYFGLECNCPYTLNDVAKKRKTYYLKVE